MPALVDERRLDLPRLCEHRLDRAGILLAGDDFARQGEQQVVAFVPLGGEAVLGRLAFDEERRLGLLRHQLEGFVCRGARVTTYGRPLRDQALRRSCRRRKQVAYDTGRQSGLLSSTCVPR